jgi:hypothetical protein
VETGTLRGLSALLEGEAVTIVNAMLVNRVTYGISVALCKGWCWRMQRYPFMSLAVAWVSDHVSVFLLCIVLTWWLQSGHVIAVSHLVTSGTVYSESVSEESESH